MRRKRGKRLLDPLKLGDLTFWEGAGGRVMWAEMPTDPKIADAVERVKQSFRERGWTQTAGD
jgi:hypothetical protein